MGGVLTRAILLFLVEPCKTSESDTLANTKSGLKAVLITDRHSRQLRFERASPQPELLYFAGKLFRKSRLDVVSEAGNVADDGALFTLALEKWKDRVHHQVEGSYAALFSWRGNIHAVRGVYDSPPLFYTVNGSVLYVSTDCGSIMAHLPTPVIISSQAIKHFLAFSTNLADSHPFSQLAGVAAGQGVKIDRNGKIEALETYIPFNSLEPCHFSDRIPSWRQALRCALSEWRTDLSSVGLFLSGGIDSGAIAVLASQLGFPLQTINLSIPAYPDEDEWQYSHGLARHLGLASHRVVIQSRCFDDILSAQRSFMYPGINPYQGMINEGYEFAASLGVSMLWTGSVGDELYAPRRNILRDLMCAGQWLNVARLLLSKQGRDIPHLYKTSLNHLLGRRPRPIRFPDYIRCSEGDSQKRAPMVVGEDVIDAYHRQSVFQFCYLNARALEAELIAQHNIQRVHPYMHPAIVEAALTTPAYIAHFASQPKAVMRQALAGIAPPDFLHRPRVGVLLRYYYDGWAKNIEDIKNVLLDKNASWPQFVNTDVVVNALNQGQKNHAMLLLNCLAFELWLNKLRSNRIPFTFD